VVVWDLKAAECSYVAVRDALTKAGLDPDEAKELSSRSAFSRACKELKEKRTIDKVEVVNKQTRFQFTKKALEQGRLEFDYECTVTLDNESGVIECPENPELEKHAQELFAFAMQTRNAHDVTMMVQRLFNKHADLYPIHPQRGIAYFIPEQHREFTAKVDAFLTALGGRLYRLPVPKGTPEGNASVSEAVQQGLNAVLSELNATVATWDETTRQSTMEKAVEKWQTIKYKVEAYADYLESKQDQLKAGLESAKKELARRISELKPDDVSTQAA
jgi:hypothetical protein